MRQCKDRVLKRPMLLGTLELVIGTFHPGEAPLFDLLTAIFIETQ